LQLEAPEVLARAAKPGLDFVRYADSAGGAGVLVSVLKVAGLERGAARAVLGRLRRGLG
jgi:hypothetical protein